MRERREHLVMTKATPVSAWFETAPSGGTPATARRAGLQPNSWADKAGPRWGRPPDPRSPPPRLPTAPSTCAALGSASLSHDAWRRSLRPRELTNGTINRVTCGKLCFHNRLFHFMPHMIHPGGGARNIYLMEYYSLRVLFNRREPSMIPARTDESSCTGLLSSPL